MTSTRQMREDWLFYRCNYGTKVPSGMFGRTPVYAQNHDHVVALELAHFAAGYVPTLGAFTGSKRNCPAGIGGRPCQADGDDCSLHNMGIAWDIEYSRRDANGRVVPVNPHFKRKLTESQLWSLFNEGKTKYNPVILDVIHAVKNTHGEQLFQNLSYLIGDTMHTQLNVPPERQEVDWSSIPGADSPRVLQVPATGAKPIVYLPLVLTDGYASNPDRKEDVLWLQVTLNKLDNVDIDEDGSYGPATVAAVATLGEGDGTRYGAYEHAALLSKTSNFDHTHLTGGPR